jgi:hypothetical protein
MMLRALCALCILATPSAASIQGETDALLAKKVDRRWSGLTRHLLLR